jgi:diguanylate cyclase (GGDEF)-like protein
LPGTDLAGALVLAEQIRKSIGELRIEHAGAPHGFLTISAGVASITPTGDREARHLVERADQALYAAKDKGRNCVEVHEPQGGERTERTAA